MTTTEMQNALATGFNRQGRTLSESMRVKYLAALSTHKPEINSVDYRGFIITGRNGKYFVDGLPQMILSSIPKAQEAIDRCIEVRQLMAIS